MRYDIKRGDTVIANVYGTGQQSKQVMGQNLVSMTFELFQSVDFHIGDYVDVYGERYVLNDLPGYKKLSSRQHQYTCEFQGLSYDLAKVAYLFYDGNNALTEGDFSLMANADKFIDLVVANANRDQSGWTKGVVDDTIYVNQTFTNVKCLEVLATLATAFNTEWWIDGKTIHMTKRGAVQNIPLKYGKGNGLYDIERNTQTDKNIVTRLYAYGSEDNLPTDYRAGSLHLKLPGNVPYLEKNIDKYGVIEQAVAFDDIRPERIGVITTVTDNFTFTDSQIDFDVNAQLLPGVTAKVSFNTGLLAGYQFNIQSFDNSTKTFKINTNQDEKSMVLPSDYLKPQVGDEYVLIDLKMPQSYIDDAEQRLLAKAQDYINDYSNPWVLYTVTGDPINFKQRNIVLQLGNYVGPFVDTDMGLNTNIRLTGFERDLQNPWKYNSLTLQDIVNINPIVRNYVDANNRVSKLNKVIKTSGVAYSNALQAIATAEGAKQIFDYWGVTIDDEHGIVASGTMLIGSGPINNGGITGVIDQIDNTDPANPVDRSVRAFFGATYENKNTSPFRILNDGTMYSSKAVISGIITAASGKIGNWNITTNGLENNSSDDAFINQLKQLSGTDKIQAAIGTGFTADKAAVGVFTIDRTTSTDQNLAIYARASGSTFSSGQIKGNVAAFFEGQTIIQGSMLVTASSGDIYLQHIQDVFVSSTFRSGPIRVHVSDGKSFLVIQE